MNIISDRDKLSAACAAAIYAISSKSTITALDGFLLDASETDDSLTICGFDLEKGIKVTVSGDGLRVKEGGRVIINAAKLTSILRNLPQGSVSLSSDDKLMVTINSSRSEFTLHSLAAENYPQLPELSGDTAFKIKSGTLKQMLSNTLFAIAQNNARPSLNGALFEINGGQLNIVGVDGYKIAVRRCTEGIISENKLEKNFIVPGKSLSELLKLLSDSDDLCEMELTRKHIIIKFDNIVFFSRLIESEFIDYRKNIRNDANTTVVINTKEFAGGIERAALLIEDKQKSSVKLSFKKDGSGADFTGGSLCVTSATSLGKVFDECDIKISGEEIEMWFNHRFLVDTLKNISDEKIILRIESPIKALILLPCDNDGGEGDSEGGGSEIYLPDPEFSDFLYLVLPQNPMRINN